MRLTIGNLFVSEQWRMERKRSAGILARKPDQLNPPYAGCRIAAGAGYKNRSKVVARCSCHSGMRLLAQTRNPSSRLVCSMMDSGVALRAPRNDDLPSHRHLAVPHRRPDREAFRRIDDGVGVDAVEAIEVINGAGLAELLDAE